jgi:hypothetical protein
MDYTIFGVIIRCNSGLSFKDSRISLKNVGSVCLAIYLYAVAPVAHLMSGSFQVSAYLFYQG